MNSIVITLAVIALVLKVFVLYKIFKVRENSPLFFCLASIFCAMNLISLSIVLNVNSVAMAEWAIRPQYVCAMWAATLMCVYAFNAANLASKLQRLTISLYVIASAFAVAIMLSNYIVSGLTSIGYSLTAIKGEFYLSYLAYVALCFLITVSTLVYGSLRAANDEKRNRCLWALVSLLPIIVIGSILVALLHFEVKINGSGLIPLATSLFLLITLKTEKQHHLTDVRRYLPFSAERKANKELQEIFTKYTFNLITYKELKTGIEVLGLRYKYSKSDNISQIARDVGMGRSTISGLLSKHHISTTKD